MATGPQEKRKELREKRIKAEASAKGGERRENLAKIIGVVVFVAIVAVIVAVVALSGSSDDNESSSAASASSVNLDGIPQNGTILGNPNAKVTLNEFADLQCPICEQYAKDVVPDVINGPIKSGDANYDFKNWAILGEDSVLAGKAALAAAEQDRMWQFVKIFYENQGQEGTGYVTDEFLTDIAEQAGVPDIDKWNVDRESDEIDRTLLEIDQQATQQGFSGTPSFSVVNASGNTNTVEANSTDPAENVQTIIDAINQAQSQ